MAVKFSENELNYARKKFYGNLYVTDVPLSFFDKLINKLLIYFFLFKYSLVNLKRKILRNVQSVKKKYIVFKTNQKLKKFFN